MDSDTQAALGLTNSEVELFSSDRSENVAMGELAERCLGRIRQLSHEQRRALIEKLRDATGPVSTFCRGILARDLPTVSTAEEILLRTETSRLLSSGAEIDFLPASKAGAAQSAVRDIVPSS